MYFNYRSSLSALIGIIGLAAPAFGQTAAAPAPTGAQSSMSGMPGMQDQTQTGGMTMQQMMKRCAVMRQQMAAGQRMSASTNTEMAQCRQMESQMKEGANAPAPSATEDR